MSSAQRIGSLPRWLGPVNGFVRGLQRLGLATGPVHVLTVLGRVSGKPRTTPVSLLTTGGVRYIIGGMADADWVRNVRAAGWGILAHGRRRERMTLTELPVAERGAILREFPRLVPGGVFFFRKLYELPSDRAKLPDAFAGLAEQTTVFRIDGSEPA